MSASPKIEIRTPNEGGLVEKLGTVGGVPVRILTRRDLAETFQISLRTVDKMLAGEEIPYLRICGRFIRFYLPDVVEHLKATSLTSKRRVSRSRQLQGLREQGSTTDQMLKMLES